MRFWCWKVSVWISLVSSTPLEKGQITIVILPLNSLISDYVCKLTIMGIGFEVYTGGTHIDGHKNLVILSADHARTTMYQEALVELHIHKSVVRTVFDEGHFAFTANDFQQSLQDLYALRSFPMQLVVLSGTIPLQSQNVICDSFGLHNPFISCTTTHHPEIQYILEAPQPSSWHIIQQMKKVLHHEMEHFGTKDCALIFAPFLDKTRPWQWSLDVTSITAMSKTTSMHQTFENNSIRTGWMGKTRSWCAHRHLVQEMTIHMFVWSFMQDPLDL